MDCHLSRIQKFSIGEDIIICLARGNNPQIGINPLEASIDQRVK